MENKILKFECDGIDAQGKYNLEYTGYGQNISPEFVIENLSLAAKNIIKKAIPSGSNIGLYELFNKRIKKK